MMKIHHSQFIIHHSITLRCWKDATYRVSTFLQRKEIQHLLAREFITSVAYVTENILLV